MHFNKGNEPSKTRDLRVQDNLLGCLNISRQFGLFANNHMLIQINTLAYFCIGSIMKQIQPYYIENIMKSY